MGVCAVEGCNSKTLSRGYCSKHYQRWRAHGDPLVGRKPSMYAGMKCPIDGCGAQATENGKCSKHAQRERRYGDPRYVTSEEVRRLRSRASQMKRERQPHTYVKFYGRHEHRVVMEQHLGRKLTRQEVVHHKNGDKHDNRIENLELMSQSQHMREHLASIKIALAEARAKRRAEAAAKEPVPF